MKLGLEGKSVIVTGGSRGIGFAIAKAFLGEGAKVSICARGAEGVEKAVAELQATGGLVHGAAVDVGDPDALKAYIETAAAALGGLNHLVNNPSGFGRNNDEEGWKKGIDIDLMGVVRASWAAIPLIEASGGGSLVHISSISGLGPSTRTPPYGAVKAAVIQYTLTQAAELAGRGIRVNCIAPGSVEFPGGVWDDMQKNNPAVYQRTLAGIPSGRMGRPEEIANVAVFLASDAASWVTGQTVSVDGGQMLT